MLGGHDVVAMIEAMTWWERVLVPAIGGLGAGLVGLWMARVRGGSGVGYVMEAIVLGTRADSTAAQHAASTRVVDRDRRG